MRRKCRIADWRGSREPDPNQQTEDRTEMEHGCYTPGAEHGLHANILPGISASLHENYLGTWGKTWLRSGMTDRKMGARAEWFPRCRMSACGTRRAK